MKAVDLLKLNEEAIVVFTRDKHLDIRPDGTGSSGHWKVDSDRLPGKLIIMNRPGDSGVADILIANITGSSPSPSPHDGRTILFFSQVRNFGSTESNWIEFSGGGQNPVHYISGNG